jgi:hypothetical protein
MKRTRISQRSKTNSRPAEDLPVRREYAEKNEECELSIWFSEQFPDRDGSEIHHIFGGRSGRNDLVSNLVRVSRDAHDFCGVKCPTDGRILCIWIKCVKGELDLDEFKTASGFFLPGWLLKSEATHDFVKPYLEKLRVLYP